MPLSLLMTVASVLLSPPGVDQPAAGKGTQDPPAPPIVTPAPASAEPVRPPSDAVVLFDGTSVDEWTHADGSPARWTPDGTKGGAMTCKPGSGSIVSKRRFGDAQIHVEFATPAVVDGEGQGRGNSGVYIQSRYEVQVLDSYENATYPDGQCGAIYGQRPPMVNACRKPGEWQTYDIIFRAARIGKDGKVTERPRITVFHNGVLIHDDVEILAPTGAAPGRDEAADGPIYLQDHGNTVRYRNIWVRPLATSGE
jgi:Domain of Unknown Function (DUF1080)